MYSEPGSQNSDVTEGTILDFAYDLGVTVLMQSPCSSVLTTASVLITASVLERYSTP
jgi:hypothetical protein